MGCKLLRLEQNVTARKRVTESFRNAWGTEVATDNTGEAPPCVWSAPFVGLEFDDRLMELRLHGQARDCERAPLRLLRVLLERPREVVSHDELLQRVWRRSKAHISRQVLTNAVRKLRQALGDERHELIVAHPGHGYSLQAEITRSEVSPLPALEQVLDVGRVVPGRADWVLQRRLDEGGANPVWCGEHQATAEKRVFKFAGDGFRLAALRREVTIGRLLREALGDRPQFVPVHGWNLEQAPFFIECALGGLDLPRWVAERGGCERIPLAQRVALVAAAAEAVALAHSVGVLHKDVKPSNLLVSESADGNLLVRLVDFGNGRLIEPEILEQYNITRDRPLPQATDTDQPLGTLKYMAPELFAEDAAPTTGADVYARRGGAVSNGGR
jgi:Serine/threonine protein kinase